MAIYTTFFLADPKQLVGGFPGWKLPLPVPVRREFRNPFTKQLVTVESREPEWPEQPESPIVPQYRATAIKGRYEDYLEERLPPFVSANPHWAAKGLTDIELEPLLNAIGVSTKLESAIYAPPSSSAVLLELPTGFLSKVLECDQGEATKRWASEMSTQAFTHSASGRKLKDGWTAEQASQILTPIISLARKANSNHRMYLLIEA
jgi:hypothetical protein